MKVLLSFLTLVFIQSLSAAGANKSLPEGETFYRIEETETTRTTVVLSLMDRGDSEWLLAIGGGSVTINSDDLMPFGSLPNIYLQVTPTKVEKNRYRFTLVKGSSPALARSPLKIKSSAFEVTYEAQPPPPNESSESGTAKNLTPETAARRDALTKLTAHWLKIIEIVPVNQDNN